jgi:hypothetical protein
VPRVLALHRKIGTAAGVWALGVAIASERDARGARRRPLTRVLLLGGAALVGVTGLLGGMLSQGADFFDW